MCNAEISAAHFAIAQQPLTGDDKDRTRAAGPALAVCATIWWPNESRWTLTMQLTLSSTDRGGA
jgi:hypothetical protein